MQKVPLISISTDFDLPTLKSLGLKFASEYPLLYLPSHQAEPSSELDWIIKSIKQSIQILSITPQSISTLISLSRYGTIPICNLSAQQQPLNHLIDIQFHRCLNQVFQTICWYNMYNVDNYEQYLPSDTNNLYINHPGLYFNYTVEIHIGLLALNTIVMFEELKNIDRETQLLIDTKLQRDADIVDELVQAKIAFKGLFTIVKAWTDDVVSDSNEVADQLLQNIQKWVFDENASPFHEPLLKRMLKRLMKRMTMQLLKKMGVLGASVIFVSGNKIILNTGKFTLNEANNFTRYLLETILSFPIFKYLTLKPVRYWKVLLFKDQFNYAGILHNQETSEESYEYEWNMNEVIVDKLKDIFLGFIGEYVMNINQYIKDEMQGNMIAKRQGNIEEFLVTKIKSYILDEMGEKLYGAIPILEHLRKQFKLDFLSAQKDVQSAKKQKQPRISNEDESNIDQDEDYDKDSFIVDDGEEDELAEINSQHSPQIRKKTQKQSQESWEIPVVLGQDQRVNRVHPIIQMINSLFHVLDLYEGSRQYTIIIKKNICRILELSEYDLEQEYVEGIRVLLGEDLVCQECFYVQDLDIFRQSWNCVNCKSEFGSVEIERVLLYELKYLNGIREHAIDSMPMLREIYYKWIQDNTMVRPILLNYDKIRQNLITLSTKHGMNCLLYYLQNFQ